MSTPEEIAQPESWRTVPGFEGAYEVSDMGRVRSLPRRTRTKIVRGQILKPDINETTGYLLVRLQFAPRMRNAFVHALVLEAFVGPRPGGKQCSHANDVKSDNRLTNLSWATPVENCAIRKALGHDCSGEASSSTELTDSCIRQIRAECARGDLQREVAARHGITQSAVSKIVLRQTWSHVR